MRPLRSLLTLLLALPLLLSAQTTDDGCPPLPADTATTDSIATDSAQERRFREIVRKTGRGVKMAVRNFDAFDTTYIEPNHYDWTFMMQNTNFFQIVSISARDEVLGRQTLDFAPKASCKIGPYIGWKWIFLGYTIDVSRPKRAGKMTEFSLSLYSNMVGGDFVYIKNTNDFSMRSVSGFEGFEHDEFKGTDFSGLSTRTLSVNAYYVLNHRRFSYPAAYNQSTVQKRSAGSVIIGFRYDQQRINFDHTRLPNRLLEEGTMSDELKFTSLEYRNYCINVGYAYNWVVARNCLLAISMTPAIGYKKLKGERITGKSVLNYVKNFNFDFIGRAGFVWNTSKMFAGCSVVSHMYDYRRNRFSVANSLNYLNVYAGFYFKKRAKGK